MAISLKGDKELRKRIKELEKRYPRATAQAVFQKGLEIMAESVKQVPVDTGRLRATHYVSPPDQNNEVELGYGTTYAVPVHERTEAAHPVGNAKFLEIPLNAAKRDYLQDMVKKINANIGPVGEGG